MSRATPLVHLAPLDEGRPATLDPAVWAGNLAALGADQPELAAELQGLVLGPAWRPTYALDDYLTWRTDEPGQPAAWLADTAAPLTRATSQLGEFDPKGRNPALPCLGAGAELQYLLAHLPAHLALFVFEADPRTLGAVLRTQDLAAQIARGRCLLLPPGREPDFLAQHLEAYPGLLPPGDILLPSLVSPQRVEELRRICEHLVTATTIRRVARVEELCAPGPAARGGPALPASPRLALLALQPHAPTHAVAGSLERAAGELGWAVVARTYAAARDAHALGHCQALVDFRPDLTVFVNHPRGRLRLPQLGKTCIWFLNEAAIAGEPAEDALYLAASPRVAAALRAAGWPAQLVHPWYWACEPARARPGTDVDLGTVVLVGDLPNADPAAHGVTSSTHRRLWEALCAAAVRTEAGAHREPEARLRRAERESGVELEDSELRAAFVRLTEHVVTPMVILERIAAMLARSAERVLAVGTGWQRVASGNLQPLATGLHELPAAEESWSPRACVFAGAPDPLSAALLHAAARAWPLLIHGPSHVDLEAKLGGVLRAAVHFEPFTTLDELRRAVEALRRWPPQIRQRTARTREHVCQEHSYQRRLTDLLAYFAVR